MSSDVRGRGAGGQTRSTDRRSENPSSLGKTQGHHGGRQGPGGQQMLSGEGHGVDDDGGGECTSAASRAQVAIAVMIRPLIPCWGGGFAILAHSGRLGRIGRLLRLGDRHRAGPPLRDADVEAQRDDQQAPQQECAGGHGRRKRDSDDLRNLIPRPGSECQTHCSARSFTLPPCLIPIVRAGISSAQSPPAAIP